jgi:hypothetical protein
MENPVNNGCKPNERYGRSDTARLLGVTRPTITNYEKKGLRFGLDKFSGYHIYKGIDIIKFYNTATI